MDSKQAGPIYGAQLIELLKCGGMLQAMPSRGDLQEAQKKHTRVGRDAGPSSGLDASEQMSSQEAIDAAEDTPF